MIQTLGRRFTAAHNRRQHRSGALWQQRFGTTVVDPDEHFLDSLRFVEAAPVRVGLAASAADYPWSSAPHHAGRIVSSLIDEHPMFWRLGNTPFEREANHQRIMEQALTPVQSKTIEHAVRRGWVLGSDRFAAGLGEQTKRRLRPLARGRPSKPTLSTRRV
jgi:putative transposase